MELVDGLNERPDHIAWTKYVLRSYYFAMTVGDNRLSVRDAAQRLGIEPMSVRRHINAGSLSATKRGRDWSIDAASVERLARQRHGRGRALAPHMAWAILLLASDLPVSAQAIAGHVRYRSRAAAWLAANPLAEHADRLRVRATGERFDLHPAEVSRLLAREGVMRTGLCAAQPYGLIGGREEAELYAPASARGQLVEEHALSPGAGPGLIRWVRDDLWPLIPRREDGSAPEGAVLVDLLENDDPRARRVAARVLRA